MGGPSLIIPGQAGLNSGSGYGKPAFEEPSSMPIP